MLTHFFKILTTLRIIYPNRLKMAASFCLGICILNACSPETPEDEKYGTIGGNFPRLVDVPDRPRPPNQQIIDSKIKNLEQDRLDAQAHAQKNLDMVKR